MATLIIEKRRAKTASSIRAVIGFYLTLFCGYIVFNEASVDRYGTLFYTGVVATFIALMLLLANTLWVSDKNILVIDDITIVSKVKLSKFKIDWAAISNVTIGDSGISFFIDGGRKERKLDFSELLYKDVDQIKQKVKDLCKYKNIAINQNCIQLI